VVVRGHGGDHGRERLPFVQGILLTVLGVAVLIIGWRYAENGRFVQIDPGKRPEGSGPVWRMDTRTGQVLINE
jgi:hypothetical protein